jgi:hypothetical protein
VQRVGERLLQISFIPLLVVFLRMIGIPSPSWAEAWIDIAAVSTLLACPLAGFFLLNRAGWPDRALKDWKKGKRMVSNPEENSVSSKEPKTARALGGAEVAVIRREVEGLRKELLERMEVLSVRLRKLSGD